MQAPEALHHGPWARRASGDEEAQSSAELHLHHVHYGTAKPDLEKYPREARLLEAGLDLRVEFFRKERNSADDRWLQVVYVLPDRAKRLAEAHRRGSLDQSGLQSGLVEPSGEPASTPYFSGDFSGTTDVSGESSAATSTSGEASGLPEVTLITSELVEGVTEPTVSQELGQRPPVTYTPQLFESSGEASASGDVPRFPGSGVEVSSVPESSGETSAYPEAEV